MRRFRLSVFSLCFIFTIVPAALAQTNQDEHGHGPQKMPKLTDAQSAAAEANYQRYCALCHGADRAGGANDHAPSLKSKSLFSSGMPQPLLMSMYYGRPGTPMGGYLNEIGGPLDMRSLQAMALWLYHQSGAELNTQALTMISGDATKGRGIYARECAQCHGESGEGGIGTALGNAAMLAVTPDHFLRFAIENGRDGTKMPAFKDKLQDADIDAVTAFLRSRASGWVNEKPVLHTPPAPEDYAINPHGPAPTFALTDGLFVSAEDLNKAINDGERMILLDTRVTSQWQVAHIKGAVPLPYYSNFNILSALPKDTWIVAYCECPRAAAQSVTRQLRQRGYDKTAVLYEGVYGWVGLGYPVDQGTERKKKDAGEP
jgi:cbb3-type cytochrome c oxidase subunit III